MNIIVSITLPAPPSNPEITLKEMRQLCEAFLGMECVSVEAEKGSWRAFIKGTIKFFGLNINFGFSNDESSGQLPGKKSGGKRASTNTEENSPTNFPVNSKGALPVCGSIGEGSLPALGILSEFSEKVRETFAPSSKDCAIQILVRTPEAAVSWESGWADGKINEKISVERTRQSDH